MIIPVTNNTKTTMPIIVPLLLCIDPDHVRAEGERGQAAGPPARPTTPRRATPQQCQLGVSSDSDGMANGESQLAAPEVARARVLNNY